MALDQSPPPKSFLGDPITADYVPMGFNSLFFYTRNRPVFSQVMIRDMLTDPRVLFGLWLIKGPIQDKAKFEVESDSTEVIDFVQRQIDRFWRNSLPTALKALEWGYSGSEVLYSIRTPPAPQPDPMNPGAASPPGDKGSGGKEQSKPFGMAFNERDDKATEVDPYTQDQAFQDPSFAPQQAQTFIEFDRLKDIHATDLKAVTLRGELIGMHVNRAIDSNSRFHKYIYIGQHKKFWHTHWPEKNPWYGLSRLFGCFIPWWEKWSDGGYRDIRRLWFHKNSFEGGTLYFPAGGSTRDEHGNIISYKDLARELLEKKRTGGMLFLPNTVSDDRGTRQWEYIDPKPMAVPAGLLDYGALLDKEILEGLGVPTEIIESSGEQGFGASSGRQVPETAFYAILQGLVNPLIEDFKKQVLEPLVAVNFGPDIEFDVIPTPMTASTDEQSQSPMQVDPQTGQPIDPNLPPDNLPPQE